MEIRKSTKLPDGVGKKIIEALRRQSESTDEMPINEETMTQPVDSRQEINQTEDLLDNSPIQEDLPENIEQDNLYNNDIEEPDFSDFSLNSDDKIGDFTEEFNSPLEEDCEPYQEEPYESYIEESVSEFESELHDDKNPLEVDEPEEIIQQQKYVSPKQTDTPKHTQPTSTKIKSSYDEVPQRSKINKSYLEDDYDIPKQRSIELSPETNISVLMKLVSRLPAGVTRQTGAQIIRQTMEAMGISMSKVLTEAQQLQDELAQSIRNNINTIEEYRNNIRSLEKEVQSCKSQSEELEDLINLFIMSDKNLKA